MQQGVPPLKKCTCTPSVDFQGFVKCMHCLFKSFKGRKTYTEVTPCPDITRLLFNGMTKNVNCFIVMSQPDQLNTFSYRRFIESWIQSEGMIKCCNCLFMHVKMGESNAFMKP